MPLVSFFEQAFTLLLRLPELWLETWRQILRHPFKAPILLALVTRRSFNVAIPSPIFYILNVVMLSFLASALFTKGQLSNVPNVDLLAYSKLEDPNAVRTVFVGVIVTSVATFCFIMLARSLRIGPRLARVLSASLVYSLSIQLFMIIGLMFFMYGLETLFPSMDYYRNYQIIFFVIITSCLSFGIWTANAAMLIRVSPWNTIRGVRRFIIYGTVIIVCIIIIVGLLALSSLISHRTLKLPPIQTVDIVDGQCQLAKDGLLIRSVVHNNSTRIYKIDAINAKISYVDSSGPRSGDYIINLDGGPRYLEAETTGTIVATTPSDKFLEEILTAWPSSSDGIFECSYNLNLSLPSGNFKKDKLQLSRPN